MQFLRLSCESPLYSLVMSRRTPTDSPNISGGGVATAENRLALKAGPAAGPRNGGGPVNVLVGSGASGHDFEDKVIPGEREKRKNYQVVKLCSGGQRHIQRLVVCQFSRLSGNEGVLEVVSRRAIVHQQLYGVAAVSEATPPQRTGQLKH